jgi:hypothetical protein
MNKIILAVAIFFTQVASSQNISQQVDTFRSIKWYQTNAFRIAAVPTVLIGYSLTIMKDHGLYSSYNAHDYAQEHYPNFHTEADNYLPAFPAVLMYSLDLAGIKSKNNGINQTIMLVMAQATNAFLTWSTKELTHVERPDGSDNFSFPSGHTSASFVMAEVLHQEFKEKSVWISVAGYTVATAVGAMRMLNNKHWLSDVVAGAGFGIFSVKLSYLLYPKIQKKACSENAVGL